MPATKFLSASVPNAVSTAPAGTAVALTRSVAPTAAPAAQASTPPSLALCPVDFNRWQHVIDYQLIQWGCHPSDLQDDGLQPPSPEVLARAIRFAQEVQRRGYAPPTSVYPDPNGGIVFELRQKRVTEKFHFWDDGEAEYFRFDNTKLVERRPLE
jgi:hypothetical protein